MTTPERDFVLPWSRLVMRFAPNIACAIATLFSAAAIANPTDRAPAEVLSLHGTIPEALLIGKQAIAAEQKLREWVVKANDDALSGKQLSQAYVALEQLLWQAKILAHYGEPTASDLLKRAEAARWPVENAIERFKRTPEGARYFQGIAQVLASTKLATLKSTAIEKLTKLVQQRRFSEAEKLLAKTYGDIWPYTAYVAGYGRGVNFKPFETVNGAITAEMSRQRIESAKQAFAERNEAWVAARDRFQEEIDAAMSEFPSSGAITFDGEPMSGPAAIESLNRRWANLHMSLNKLAAFDLALGGKNQPLLGEQTSQLTRQMEQCYSEIISADAVRLAPDAAQNQYTDYLQALARIIDQVDQWAPETTFAGSLSQLATKAGIADLVSNYESATWDILRWRRKLVAVQRRSLQQDYKLASTELQQKMVTRPEFAGLYSEQQPDSLPLLTTPASIVFANLAQHAMNAKITATHVVRLSGEKPYFMTRLDDGIYCRLPSKFTIETGLAGLTSDLLVDADHPPWTMTAAMALGAAERGDYAAVGGEVVGVEMSGFVNRHISLPSIADSMLYRDRVLSMIGGEAPTRIHGLDLVAIQLSIKPTWVASHYFLAKVSPSTD